LLIYGQLLGLVDAKPYVMKSNDSKISLYSRNIMDKT